MKSGYITLPSRDGWCVEVICKNGQQIFKTLLARDYPTRNDVEHFINCTYGITKKDCSKYEISECIM